MANELKNELLKELEGFELTDDEIETVTGGLMSLETYAKARRAIENSPFDANKKAKLRQALDAKNLGDPKHFYTEAEVKKMLQLWGLIF